MDKPPSFPKFLQDELSRNMPAYFLALTGILCIQLAHYIRNDSKSMDVLLDVGKGMTSAALLAFQNKRTPDGNTTTTQVTTPEPKIAPVPEVRDTQQ